MRGIPEDQFAPAASTDLNVGVGGHVNELRRRVEAGAVYSRSELEVEGRAFTAAGGGGACHPAAQAHQAGFMSLGVAPNVLVLLFEDYLRELLGFTIQFSSKNNRLGCRHGHGHAIVANNVFVAGLDVQSSAEKGPSAVGVAELADPGAA